VEILGDDRKTIWVDPEFKKLRDQLSVDLDMKKEDVTRELASMAKNDYDGIVKKLLKQKGKETKRKKKDEGRGGFDPIF